MQRACSADVRAVGPDISQAVILIRLAARSETNLPRPRYYLALSINYLSWRREWDSNPRYGFPHTRFPSVRLKPLGHLSGWPVLKGPRDFCKGARPVKRLFPQPIE